MVILINSQIQNIAVCAFAPIGADYLIVRLSTQSGRTPMGKVGIGAVAAPVRDDNDKAA